jgi:hypothetical protein
MVYSPAIHVKSRNLASTTITLCENTQETNGTVVDWIWPQRTERKVRHD